MAVSNQASPTTVLIVDDHHLWRRGLRRALEPECEIMA
jgi:DNA-binding NarL/FixJ family response regulator